MVRHKFVETVGEVKKIENVCSKILKAIGPEVAAMSDSGDVGVVHSLKQHYGLLDWEERFRAFWTVSPHLNVISIKEVYDAGSKLSPVVIAPIELSLDDIDDILSYVSKIKPKDLGKPINFW